MRVDFDVVFDGAVDVSATFVVDEGGRSRSGAQQVNDKDGVKVHGAVDDQVDDSV